MLLKIGHLFLKLFYVTILEWYSYSVLSAAEHVVVCGILHFPCDGFMTKQIILVILTQPGTNPQSGGRKKMLGTDKREK